MIIYNRLDRSWVHHITLLEFFLESSRQKAWRWPVPVGLPVPSIWFRIAPTDLRATTPWVPGRSCNSALTSSSVVGRQGGVKGAGGGCWPLHP